MKKADKKGFNLIELMIVVAIIGILAAIAIPNFLNYMCKSKQSEARQMLGTIATGEEAFYAENNRYTQTKSSINFTTKGTPKYVYSIPTATATQFLARARSTQIKGTAPDNWYTTQRKNISNATNACD